MPQIRLAIVGLGLMGGSLALACKERAVCREVIGIARRPETVRQALALNAVDRATTSLAEGVAGADVIVLATPVRTLIRQIQQLASLPLQPCLLLDLGSTKTHVLAAMETLPPQIEVVGAHPMCGKETSGLEAADASLFQDAPWVVTPLARTSLAAVNLVKQLGLAVGGCPLVLDAARHDRLVASISHLPYALAVALVLTAGDVAAEDDILWSLAASGFRDTSRLAASDVTMMLDILLTNQEAVGELLGRASERIKQIADLISTGDEENLRKLLSDAREQRIDRSIPQGF